MGAPALPAPQPANDPPYGVHISLWGIEFTIPLSKAALYSLAVGLVLVATLAGLSKYYVVLRKTEWSDTHNDAIAYAQLLPTTELAEFKRHFGESPQSTFPGPSGVQLGYYKSDGCILVSRSSPGLPVTQHWVLDLSRVQLPTPPQPNNTQQAPVKASQEGQKSEENPLIADLKLPAPFLSLPNVNRIARGQDDLIAFASEREIAQAGNSSRMLKRVQMPPGGRCWNPHPGQFQWAYGQVNGCLVQVWRTWQDGCSHYQWYNRCYNYFDPAINWVRCVH